MSLATDAIYRKNSKSKRYTAEHYKRSFLQSSNGRTQVTLFCNTSSADDGPKLDRKYLGNN